MVIESAYGQLAAMVREALYGMPKPLHELLKPGVGITAEEVVEESLKMLLSRKGGQ
jgi:2-oxoglutarate ferredoxin oxidoreductase subunit alpha